MVLLISNYILCWEKKCQNTRKRALILIIEFEQSKQVNTKETRNGKQNWKSYFKNFLTLSWRRSLSYRNQSIDLHWFLHDRDLRHERVQVGLSASKKICFIFFKESPFRSQDIQIFILTFWSHRKNGLIRNIRLISKFMTSQPGKKTIAIHILPNIS